jgi:hypothetical protein
LSRPAPAIERDGPRSSESDPTSRPLWQTPHGFANTDASGKTAGGGGEFHKQAMQWPTPCANDDNKSPEARMAMKASMPGGPRQTITSLQVLVKAQTSAKAKLNPLFVEWLMGLPLGWTGFAPVETALYRSRLRQHLRFLLGG